jgi:glycosyltransferase involved in cell wall biosynthesis
MQKIDVIIPVFNGERFISQAIQSVLDQGDNLNSIWLINDGSTDKTFEILNEYEQEYKIIQVIHQTNRGVSTALNMGLSKVKSEWVAFLDADDIWVSDRIKAQLLALEANPKAELVFGQMEEFEDFPEGLLPRFRARKEIYAGFCRSTMLCKKYIFEEFGGFDELLKVGEFIDWFQKVRQSSKEFHLVPKVLAKRRIHGENMTAKVNRQDYLTLIRRQLSKNRKE